MRVGLAGLGNIGSGTLRLLRAQAGLLKLRGHEIEVTAVSARSKDKVRDCDLTGITWVDDAMALPERGDVDVVVEVIGGSEGIAKHLAMQTLERGKHYVTANKALIAAHGVELAKSAEKDNLQLAFEAAVCGGMPILKTLREGLAGNSITSFRGILNGTCNFILTRMSDSGGDFRTALSEAQSLGYAERDPSDDVDGHDAANKLAILTALAFGVAPCIANIHVEGIRAITQTELKGAYARGGRIKLLGISERSTAGVVQRVQPIFLPLSEPLSRVGGAFNAVDIACDFAGDIFIQGLGAGGDATASAIVADLVDIARGNRSFAFGIPASSLV